MFQKSYSTTRQQIVLNQKTLITEERNNLSSGISHLENEIENDKIEFHQKLKSKIENLERQNNELAEMEKNIIRTENKV